MATMKPTKVMERDRPTVDPQRSALVTDWCDKMAEWKDFYKDTFKGMRDDASFARGNQWDKGDKTSYVANITLRHINQRVAAIYSKNPRIVAQRRKRMNYLVWDGSPDSLAQAQMAMQASAQTGMPPPPEVMSLLQDVKDGHEKQKMMDRVAKTLQLVAQYSLDEPIPNFKKQAKQLVRRVLTCKVGYVKLGYQRVMGRIPEIDAKLKDVGDKIAYMERIAADMADGEIFDGDKELEELKLGLADLQNHQEQVVREGLIFDFPRAWSIIIDPDCHQLSGFLGASAVAQEFLFTPNQVKEIYGVDVGKNYSAHTATGDRGDKRKKGQKDSLCAVYEIYDLRAQMVHTVCLGYPDFLKEPATPDIWYEQFHPFFPLMFNEVEDDEDIYPVSEVELVEPMQREINRARESVRQHRIANRPAWLTAKGMFDGDSKDKLATHAINELLETNLKPGEDVAKAIQPKPVARIDPATYETESVFTDMLRVSSTQEANLGPTSGATATETTVAEASRASSMQSNVDDLDEFFTSLMRAAGQVLLREMSAETVKKIAGPGASWPEMSPQDVAEEVYLEVKAGSSGRPNKALKIAALERTGPLIMQIPGIKPAWLAGQFVQEIDEGIDLEEAIADGLPSIIAMNGAQQPNTGNPATEPTAQGAKGGNNAPAGAEPQPTARGQGGMARMRPAA